MSDSNATKPNGTSDTGRREFLGRVGVVATGSAVAFGGMGMATPAYAAATAVTAENVKDHGALGNGVADDSAAIQAALNAVPANGGAVFLPPGDHLVGTKLVPKSQTVIFGTHSPRYEPVSNPSSACKIRAKSPFTLHRNWIDRTDRIDARCHHP